MKLDGHFAVEYRFYVKHGTPTVNIYYEVAIDTLAYYGATLLAGPLTANDSALVFIVPIYGQYIRFYFDDAVCVADDTSKIKLRINGHWLGVNNDPDSLGHYPASYYLNNVSDVYGWLAGDSTQATKYYAYYITGGMPGLLGSLSVTGHTGLYLICGADSIFNNGSGGWDINGTLIKSNGSIVMPANDTLFGTKIIQSGVANTVTTGALDSLYRLDTNNVATNRVGLAVVIDSSPAGTTNKHIGLSIGGTGIGGKTASYYLACDGIGSVYIRGDGLFSGTNFRSGGTTYYNSNVLNVVTTSNYTFQNTWASGYDWIFKDKGLATAAENANFAQWQDSTGRIVHQLGGTNSGSLGMTGNDSLVKWDSAGLKSVIDGVQKFAVKKDSVIVNTDFIVNGLIKSRTMIISFYDKDIQQYLLVPRNASINYEKPPVSIAEPDSIIIDSVSFMAFFPPGTGADSNQIDSIWIKCDWSLIGEASGPSVWSYGTDLITTTGGFHKFTGLIKTSGTGKFHPTDRFIVYITGKKNENNTVEMMYLGAYCHYK